MTFTKAVLGTVVGMQSLAVLGNASKMLPRETQKGRDLQNQPKKMVKGAVETLIGVSLIRPTANIVSSL